MAITIRETFRGNPKPRAVSGRWVVEGILSLRAACRSSVGRSSPARCLRRTGSWEIQWGQLDRQGGTGAAYAPGTALAEVRFGVL